MSSGLHRRPTRITTRLVAWICSLLALSLIAFAGVTLALTSRDLNARLDAQVAQAAERSMGLGRREGRGRDPLQAPGQGAGVLTVVVVNGQVSSARRQDDDGDVEDLTSPDVDAVHTSGVLDAAHEGRPGEHFPVKLYDVRLSVGEYRLAARTHLGEQTVIVTGLPTASVTGPLSQLALVETLGILATTALAAALMTWVIRRSLQPLEEVSAVATRIASLPLDDPRATLPSDRVPALLSTPGTEVGNVGSALNHLLDNISTALIARQRSEQSLREFVADASHELRTPLASVRGYTDLLRLTEDLTPEGRTSLDRVESQARRMNALVDDLLLLARLDASQAAFLTDVDLGELVVESVLDAQTVGRDHQWRTDVDGEPAVVHGDPRQLGQVVMNLLSNARKHTAPGTMVTTTLRRDAGWAVLRVHDDGPGIPEDFRDRLFERFSRADVQRSAGPDSEGSSGLGLAIVAAIVERHGGEVTCESVVADAKPGEPSGTTFTVRLPLVHEA